MYIILVGLFLAFWQPGTSLEDLSRGRQTSSTKPRLERGGPSRLVVDGNDSDSLYDPNNNSIPQCLYTTKNQKTAFWQVNLEQDVVIDHVVVIFQKGNTSQRKQQKRRNGYSIIVTDSPTYLPMTSANTCYNDKDPDLSAENHENRSCSIIGNYVTIYNQRKTLSGPNYSKNAVLELCEVHVMGCPLTKYGTECKEDCPENCKNRLCFPRNGTCMKGCSPGYLPPKCGQASIAAPKSKSNSAAGILGGVVSSATVVIILLVSLGAVVIKRRRHYRNMFSIRNAGNDQEQGVVYDDVTSDIHMDDEPNHTGMITFESVINNCRENVVSRKTLTEHLRMEIARKENCDEFERDFNDFKSGIQFPCEESVKDENMKKNRYTNIIPYDHSRVQLGNRSYINANFIKNLEGTNEYVATQGPKGCTLGDFWQMVWQLKTKKIVMLAKCIEMAKRKVDQYWPDSGDPIEHYNLKLSLTSSNQYAAYTVRELMLENKKTNEKRVVTQFHFKKWPDNDIPDVMHFALFLLHVESVKPSSSGPMIVHCSAGVGRTGVFIASDALYKHGKYTEGVNPAAYIHSMRKDRMDMVQTKPQYIFIYRALLELFLIDKSSLTMGDFKSQYLQSSCLLQDYHMLDDNRPILPNDQIAGGMEPENEKKNRDRKILPGYTHRPLLSSQPGNRTGYINAVFLPSVQNNERYIATQWPLPHTADDFWAMIYDHRSTAVAILDSDADTNDPYLMPSKEEAEITTAHFSIRFKNKPRIENSVVIADMYLSKIGDYDSLQLKIFRMCDWPKSNQTCVSGCVVQMVSAVHRYQLNDTSGGPVTVVCRNGSSKCGIFCAVANAIENISLNRQISLVQVVRQLQLRRPSFINTKTSYLLCNREVDAHLNTMSEYQNLGGPSPQ